MFRYIALLVFLSINALAQETIECQKDYCSIPSNIQLIKASEFLDFSAFEIISTDEDINIDTRSYSRDFKGLLNTYSDKGVELTIDSKSSRDDKTGSNFVFFADSVSNLNIANSGFDGNIHPNSSYICASNIRSGKYGYNVKNLFEERRENDPTLSIDKCDDIDLQNIRQKSTHTCDENYTKSLDGLITAQRHTIYKKCIGDAARKLCVAKKLKLTCLWKGDKTIGDSSCCSSDSLPKVGAENWSCDTNLCDSTNSGWYRNLTKIITEDYYQNQISKEASNLCQQEFPRDFGDKNVSVSINRDYGDFGWYYATRDFSHDIPNLSQRKYYRLEINPVQSCNTHYTGADKCVSPPSTGFRATSGFVSLGGMSSIKCSMSGSRVNCIYRHSSQNVDNRLINWMRVEYQTRVYYIDPSGYNRYHQTHITVEHEGYGGQNAFYDPNADDDFWSGGQ